MSPGPELRPEDFGPDALADIAFAASAVIAVVADVDHHHNAEGGWDPWTDNPVEEIRLVRGVIAQIDDGLKEARRRLADVERPARLAAARRARRAQPDAERETER